MASVLGKEVSKALVSSFYNSKLGYLRSTLYAGVAYSAYAYTVWAAGHGFSFSLSDFTSILFTSTFLESSSYPSNKEWINFFKKKNISSDNLSKTTIDSKVSSVIGSGLFALLSLKYSMPFIDNGINYIDYAQNAVNPVMKNLSYLNTASSFTFAAFISYAAVKTGTVIGKSVNSLRKHDIINTFNLSVKKYDFNKVDEFKKYSDSFIKTDDALLLKKIIEGESITSALGVVVDSLDNDGHKMKSKGFKTFERKLVMFNDKKTSPLEMFIMNVNSKHLEPELKNYYADEAIKIVKDTKNISQLSLFSFYKGIIGEDEEARALDDLISIYSESLPLDEKQLSDGADGGVQQVFFSSEKNDPVRYTILKKSSSLENKLFLKEEFDINNIFSDALKDDFLANAPEVHNFTNYKSKDGEEKVRFTMKQYRYDTLLEYSLNKLKENKHSDIEKMFSHVYDQLSKYKKVLSEQDLISIPKIDLRDKYISKADSSVNDMALLDETISIVESLDHLSPVLDYHPLNIIVRPGKTISKSRVYKIDTRNNGYANAMTDIVNLLNFSAVIYDGAGLSSLEDKFLEPYKNILSENDLLLLYGASLRLRQDSWFRANKKFDIIYGGPQTVPLLNHMIKMYSDLEKRLPSEKAFFSAQKNEAMKLLNS